MFISTIKFWQLDSMEENICYAKEDYKNKNVESLWFGSFLSTLKYLEINVS